MKRLVTGSHRTPGSLNFKKRFGYFRYQLNLSQNARLISHRASMTHIFLSDTRKPFQLLGKYMLDEVNCLL